MKPCFSVGGMLLVCASLVLPATARDVQVSGNTTSAVNATTVSYAERAAMNRFQGAQPGTLTYREGSHLSRLYGRILEMGDTPDQTAERFLTANADLFGAEAADLLPTTRVLVGGNTTPLMYEPEKGTYKFTLVYYTQYRDGRPVFRSDVRLLVRNQPGYPLVWVGSGLRRLGNFHANTALRSAVDPTAVAPEMTSFTAMEPVIWAGLEDQSVTPVQAVTFEASNDGSGESMPQRWLYVVAEATGEVLYSENLILMTDVTGSVHGMATTIPKSDTCNPEEGMAMPWAKVSIGGTTVYTDADGNFTIPNEGTSSVTVTSEVAGLYFSVDNVAGSEETLTISVTPPGPADFMHNADNTDELVRAQTNAYVQANIVRDWVLTHDPNYPFIKDQTDFPIYVNRSGGFCPGAAWYDTVSINFCRAGTAGDRTRPNMAFSSVVHHEFGHHIVACGGSGQGQYGEGLGDSVAVCIADDPGVGYGFDGDCNANLRTADNTMQYPCTIDNHTCGQVLSGCIWSTRNQLIVTNPDTYRDILSSLLVNSVPMHTGGLITPQITIDFLTLDDNDTDPSNGTPHRHEICAGFGAHNMTCPPWIYVTPTAEFTSTGPSGGPFTPQCQTYTLSNSDSESRDWTADATVSWLDVSPTAGTLPPATEATVIACVNANADSLPLGIHTGAVTFTDTSISETQTRIVTVYVVGALHVPGEYATIQAAIDTAAPGSDIIVADGIYTGTGNKNLDFHGKAISLRSQSGDPAACIIDCQGSGRGFYFHTGETATSLVDGFCVRNGYVIPDSPGGGCGGGLFCSGASPTLTNCTISGNKAHSYGGGVYCISSSPTLTNCTISSNAIGDGAGYGGGVYCHGSSPILTNCTIGRNAAPTCGGVYCFNSSSPTLTNCILWADTLPEIVIGYMSAPLVTYCNVQGGYAGIGNINADPSFAFADDFHLMSGSPCIDAGTNDPTGGLPTTDIEGTPRPIDGEGDEQAIADMGAYELDPDAPAIAVSPSMIEVSIDPGGSNPQPMALSIRNSGGGVLPWQIAAGCAWVNADPDSGSCQQEVDSTSLSFNVAGLAAGYHFCWLTISSASATNTPRYVLVRLHIGATLSVPSEYSTIQAALDVAVALDWVVVANGTYTGEGNMNLDFHGKAIRLRSVSGDPNACIIDCENSGRGFYFHSNETAASVVDGFTIRNGLVALGDYGLGGGGGVYCLSSSPTLTNCRITANAVSGHNGFGGGVYCSSSSPTLTGCVISENALIGGPELYGSGVFCDSSSPTLTNCMISGNTADGGGYGGGLGCWSSAPSITNCTISGNTITGGYSVGGGLYCGYSSSPTLTNCILWGDTPQEVYLGGAGDNPVVTYSDIQGGYTGTGNLDADPQFVDAAQSNYHLAGGSPCIDVGDNAAIPAGVTTDIDGDPRIIRGLPISEVVPPPVPPPPIPPATVDMGADEFHCISLPPIPHH